MAPPLAVLLSFVFGAIPFSQIVARFTRGIDLREVETGTVSGTALYRVAGFAPLALAGVLDVTKGAAAALLGGGPDRFIVASICSGAAVAGHNWSPFLRGAGGRGISVALGATAVLSWPGLALLVAGLILGKLLGETGLGCFAALVAYAPALYAFHGREGLLLTGLLWAPMFGKRITGNERPSQPSPRVYLSRLLFDRQDRVR